MKTGIISISHLFAVDLDVCDVVLEDGGHVHLGELVLAEDDEEARLPARAVAHDHQLLPDGRHGGEGGGGGATAAVADSVALKNRTILHSACHCQGGLSQGSTHLSNGKGIFLTLERINITLQFSLPGA